MQVSLWVTESRARDFGFTHYGWWWRIVPGFVRYEGREMHWTARSDLLAPVEDLIQDTANAIRSAMGKDPIIMVEVGREIAPRSGGEA